MSVESVLQFFQEIPDNEALQEKVYEVTDLQAILRIAARAGYSFTAEEWADGVVQIKSRRDSDINFVKNTGGRITVAEEVVGMDFFEESLFDGE